MPQTVTVRLKHTCGGGEEHWARLPITLIDETPPSISIDLSSNQDSHVSFGGVTRYVSPVVILPLIAATDACDSNPQQQCFLDGEPYQVGTPISDQGLHILDVSVVDASGNVNDVTNVFEVRERPSYTAQARVQSTVCELDPNGQTGVLTTTVLISSANFDHRDILLSSVRMILRASNGRYFHQVPTSIKDAFVVGSNVFQHESAAVSIDDCFVQMTFEAQLAANPTIQCPAALDIIGVGLTNGVISFEWGASALNIPDPQPYPDPCGDPEPPDPEPPPPCQEIQTILKNLSACTFPMTFGGPAGCAATSSTMSSARASLSGGGVTATRAVSVCPTAAGCNHPGSSCSATGNAMLVVQLVGDCCNCAISFNAIAKITPVSGNQSAGLNCVGDADADGSFSVDAPCGSVSLSTQYTNCATGCTGALNCTEHSCIGWMISQTSIEVASDAYAFANCTSPLPSTSNCMYWAKVLVAVSSFKASTSFAPCPPGDPPDPGLGG